MTVPIDPVPFAIGVVSAPLIRYVLVPAVRRRLLPWIRFRWTIRRNRHQRYALGGRMPTAFRLTPGQIDYLKHGGEIPPGYTVVNNETGIPEPVLTPADLDRIARERQGDQ